MHQPPCWLDGSAQRAAYICTSGLHARKTWRCLWLRCCILHACAQPPCLSCVQVTARDSLAGRTIALWARQADTGVAEQDAAVRRVALRWRTRAMRSRAEKVRAAAVAAPHWKLLVQLSNCNTVQEAHVLQCATLATTHGVLTADGMLEVSLQHGIG